MTLSRGRRVTDRGRCRVRGGPEGKQFRGALNWGQGDLKWGCRGHCGRESLRNWIKKAVIVLRGRWGPEGGTTLSWSPTAFLVTWLWGSRGRHCASPAHLGLGSTQRWTDGVALTPRGGSRGAWAHPTCPVNSPEPPLPSGICQAPPPTMGLLFPGPPGLWGQDWVEAIWALAARPGHPSCSFLLPSLTLQASKANG